MLKESAVEIGTLARVVRQMIAGSNPLGLEWIGAPPADGDEAAQACYEVIEIVNGVCRESFWPPRPELQEVWKLRQALAQAVDDRPGVFGLGSFFKRPAIVFCPDSGQSEIVFSFPADMTAEQILARILGEQIPSPEWLTQDI